MKVTINGQRHEVPDGATVATVVAQVTDAVQGVAVALNDEVVRRADWTATAVNDKDRVEILTAVQGG